MLNEKLIDLFNRFGAVVRVRLGGATTSYMIDAPGAKGNNPNFGVGTLRRISGRLSRSLIGGEESIFNVNVTSDGVSVEMGSKTPYAGVHEFGFQGNVTVPSHTRRITQAFGRSIAPKDVAVSAHNRFMNVSARPYLAPQMKDQEPVLAKWLEENGKQLFEGVL
jgi:phage gpG-like protein